jgi:hypothetical protein
MKVLFEKGDSICFKIQNNKTGEEKRGKERRRRKKTTATTTTSSHMTRPLSQRFWS